MDAFDKAVQATRAQEKEKEKEKLRDKARSELFSSKIKKISKYILKLMSPKGYIVVRAPNGEHSFALSYYYDDNLCANPNERLVEGSWETTPSMGFHRRDDIFSINNDLELVYNGRAIGWQDDFNNWNDLNQILGNIYGRTGDDAKETLRRLEQRNRKLKAKKARQQRARKITSVYKFAAFLFLVWLFR